MEEKDLINYEDEEDDLTFKEKEEIMKDLKEKHIQHRKFVRELEDTKKQEEEEKEKKMMEDKLKNVKNDAYMDRRLKTAKFRAKEQNERMKKMLQKVDVYMKKIDQMEKFDEVSKLKKQAEKEYNKEEVKNKVDKDKLGLIVGRLSKLNKQAEVERENNLKKRIERDKSKSKIMKNVGKELLKNILPDVFGKTRPVTGKNNNINNNIFNLFQEEDGFEGTNAMPEIEIDENSIRNKRRISSAKSMSAINGMNKSKSQSLLIQNNLNKEAESELRKILKEGADYVTLMNFKNKYKWYDITAHLHKAQMKMIKARNNKNNNYNSSLNKTSNKTISKLTKEAEEKLQQNDEDINTNQSSYNLACLYNNSDMIQTQLLACKEDSEVFFKINEKDQFGRKGILYLILNGNHLMIKLSLMSGLIMSDCRDKDKRNILHYCSMSRVDDIIETICKCIAYEYKEDLEGMIKFLSKMYVSKSLEDQKSLSEEEKNELIDIIESSIENKTDYYKEEEEGNEQNEESNQLNIYSKKGKSNQFEEEGGINTIHPMTVTNDINYYYREVKRVKVSLNAMINQTDADNRTPLHLACKNNNFEAIKTLLYYKAKIDIRDSNGNRPIDLCTSDTVIQYILAHSKNIQSKAKLEQSSFLNKILTGNKKPEEESNNNMEEILDIRNLRYIAEKQLNSFTLGYENHSYLILSVIHNKFETFCFLVQKKNEITFQNSNGWNVIHFIILHKRFRFLYYLFKKSTEEEAEEVENESNYNDISYIYDQLRNTEYQTNDIYHSKGGLNIIGNAFLALDILTNNQVNSLYMSIDSKKENVLLFKLLCSLLIKREMLVLTGNFFNEKLSLLEIIMNRKYDKISQTLLLKSVEKKSFELVEYLTKQIMEEYTENVNLIETDQVNSFNVNIYETDKQLQNVLHYTVKYSLNEKFIKHFIKLDADKNLLKSMKDSCNKQAHDYDTAKHYSNSFIHIWEAAKENDHFMLDKIIQEGYYAIDEQTFILKNSPLHIAALNCSDKVVLSLMKNNCDVTLKNSKKLTAMEICVQNKTSQGKAFLRKFKAIVNKEIVEFVQLDAFGKAGAGNLNTTMNGSSINNSLLSCNMKNKMNRKVIEILSKIKNDVEKRKLNFKKIFEAIDENKNGKLEGNEFESLFTVLDIEDVNRDDVLLLMSHLDKNKNGIIEYEEFMKILD